MAIRAVQEQTGERTSRFAGVEDLYVVRTVKGRSRTGDPAWLVAFARPDSSEIGCVWVWRPDDYRYEIDRCPRSLTAGRPPGAALVSDRRPFELAFTTCSTASAEALARAYKLPASVSPKVVARAVSGPAVGLLDLRGEAYRGCLAGMNHRDRLTTVPTALFARPYRLR
jgi:hypothetical protein